MVISVTKTTRVLIELDDKGVNALMNVLDIFCRWHDEKHTEWGDMRKVAGDLMDKLELK